MDYESNSSGDDFYNYSSYKQIMDSIDSGRDAVEAVLDSFEVDIDARGPEGRTALMDLASRGDIEMVKLLIDHDAEVELSEWSRSDTALHYAIKGKHEDVVKLLLDNKANINKPDSDGTKPLHLASLSGNKKIVEDLLAFKPKLDAKDLNGWAAIHFAVKNEHADIVELLVNAGCKINVKTKLDDQTPLHFAAELGNEAVVRVLLDARAHYNARTKVGETALFLACAKGSEKIVNMLLDAGAKYKIKSTNNRSVLHAAVKGDNIGIIQKFLDFGLDIDAVDSDGYSPLDVAFEFASERVISTLMSRGAKLVENDDRKSALHFACERGFEDIAQQLLKLGVNIHAKTPEGRTVLHSAILGGNENLVLLFLQRGLSALDRGEDNKTSLHYAAEQVNVKIVQEMLKQGINMDDKDTAGETALSLATRKSNNRVAQLLLERGANVDLTYENKENLLHLAVEHSNESLVELLLNYKVFVNACNEDTKSTPLHKAIATGSVEVVRMLIEHEADVTLVESNGRTPLRSACWETDDKREKIVRLLLDKGASPNDVDSIGVPVLHSAISNRSPKNVTALLEYGADAEAEDQTPYRQSPLIFAAHQGMYNGKYHRNRPGNVFEKIIEQLLDFGAFVDREDSSRRTAISYLSENFNPLAVQLLLNYGADCDHEYDNKCLFKVATSANHKFIVQHIVKLRKQDTFVSENNLDFIKDNSNLLKYQGDCEKEIEKMKINVIGSSTLHFFKLLTARDTNQLAAYTRNEEVLRAFKSGECKTMCPIYESELRLQIKKGVWRNLLQAKVRRFFHAVAEAEGNEGLAKLPTVCVYKIFNYLRNRDLRTLIRVCNAKLDTDLCDLVIS